ncbi:hypothetical protein [Sulfolobus tengchongensis spindle-shaped virus 3]|nr:hypothetical protein [Sulfolobus tengchongensis spindle-shaped virus 3]WDS52897.1 hypothetical protein [Sulfolobus tengchongensis spindle-shaped virus 4]
MEEQRIKVRFPLDKYLYEGLQKVSSFLKKDQAQIINEALVEYLQNPVDKYYLEPGKKHTKIVKLDHNLVAAVEELANKRNVTPSVIMRTALALYINKWLEVFYKEVLEKPSQTSSQ